jgi:hypothetical protein
MRRSIPGAWLIRAAAAAAAGAILVSGAACSRAAVYKERLNAIASDTARAVLRDTLWAHGSFYRWADHRTLRCEVTWTDVRPLATTARQVVWLLDTERGRLRIEHPAEGRVTLFDGMTWRILADGKETADAVVRMDAAGEARVLRELATVPFSLLEPGLDIGYLGCRAGPAEARAWEQLLVAYRGAGDQAGTDRTVVEVRRQTHRVEAAIIQWPELPFAGRRYRVELDDWHERGGVVLARRYRFYPADESGRRAGGMRFEARVTRLEWAAPVGLGAFSRP